MKFYGQWEYQVDKYLYENFFKDITIPGFFLEAGANDGNLHSCCKFFEESLGWNGINVEANPYLYKQLVYNRPNSINESIALTGADLSGKSIPFKIYYHPAHGINHGINFIGDNLIQKDYVENTMGFKLQKEVLVSCISYKELLHKHNINKLDLFCLDVEGCELDVLHGMKDSIIPTVLCIEYPHIGIETLIEECSKIGLKYHSKQDNNLYFISNI